MKYINILIFPVIIILFYYSFSFAQVIRKEEYKIEPEVKYKQNLDIAILSFSAELVPEREYIKDIIRNSIIDKIMLYGKIRISAYQNFKRNYFTNRQDSGTHDPETDMNSESDNFSGFLKPEILKNGAIDKLFENTDTDIVKEIRNPESQVYTFVPGADIIISGNINQNGNSIKIKIKVINSIYNKVLIIKKEDSFKNLNLISETISNEVIKSLMISYSYLDVFSDHNKSLIYVDERYFGRTDKRGILLESGIHEIVVKSEKAQNKHFHLDLQQNKTKTLSVHFSDIDFNIRKTIKINTSPDNARIYVDSDFVGISPIDKYEIEPGTYRMRIEKEGYITGYCTINIDDKKKPKNEFNIELEKGDTKEYYFERTSAYNILFKCSLWGAALSSASYVFLGLKVEDENTKLRDLSSSDINYTDKKSRLEDQRDKYKFYRQISLYSIGAMIISAGIFYYLDIAQDDISIAVHFPQNKLIKSFQPDYHLYNSMNDNFGLSINKSF